MTNHSSLRSSIVLIIVAIYSAFIPVLGSEADFPDDSVYSAETQADLAYPADVMVDSVVCEDPTTFHAKQLILPGALVAVGTFAVYNGWCRDICRDVRGGMADIRGDHYMHFDDYVQYAPVAAYLGLSIGGVKGKHSLRQRIVAGVTAYAAMAAIVNATKYTVKERRPDSSSRNSFPSGHTATAFTGAELIREEFGKWWGLGAYTVATGIAFMRLYNERHWLNDVIAGAGIGILSARIGFWMLPLYNRWFHWDENPCNPVISAVPSYDPYHHAAILSISATF